MGPVEVKAPTCRVGAFSGLAFRRRDSDASVQVDRQGEGHGGRRKKSGEDQDGEGSDRHDVDHCLRPPHCGAVIHIRGREDTVHR